MTNMKSAGEQILKADERRRVRMPLARRESLLDEFERSGLSGMKFAALAGVKYQTFATWAKKRREERGGALPPAAKAGDPVRWLEAVVQQAQLPGQKTDCSLTVHLPGGAQLELASTSQVALAAALLRALETPVTAC